MDIEIFNDPLTNSDGVMSGFSVYSCFDAAKMLNESDENCRKVSDTQLTDFLVTTKVVTKYFDPI